MAVETNVLDEIIEASYDPDPKVRKQAARDLCPCELKMNYAPAWNRLLELIHDDDADVQRIAFHTLTDGSPREREAEIIEAIKALENVKEPKLRRQVRRTLMQYRTKGKINH
ncbi:MAG: hypothetical protein O3A46_03975 [Candidatus Poribacteria bacterium]|nr:hypothetical protein [Candidatus Poribacteria bacterium]